MLFPSAYVPLLLSALQEPARSKFPFAGHAQYRGDEFKSQFAYYRHGNKCKAKQARLNERRRKPRKDGTKIKEKENQRGVKSPDYYRRGRKMS